MIRLEAVGLTDVGMIRTHNEDCFEIDTEKRLFVVADGMGGHSHGEIASRIAVETILDRVSREQSAEVAAGGGPGELSPRALALRDAIQSAHDEVLGAIARDGSLHGMGTTVAGMLLNGNKAAVAHVGDSRVYRCRKGTLERLTEDHTWVNEQVVAGFLSEEQARAHPLKNVVTRALGGEADVLVDLMELDLEIGDRFLICSDGLTTMLDDWEIESRLVQDKDLGQICRMLINDANLRGGVDNVTVVLLQLQES